jgi:arylsulfatase A-like enzyme
MSELTRRSFLQSTAAASVAAGTASADATRPNVLLIMADQMRPDVMGAYGNPAIRTPHLDALAAGGTRFTECWAQHPVCMPSRASIFTGRYPSVHGVRTNGISLPRHETTLAQAFLDNGYRTGGAGKFHFIPHYPYRSPLPTMETHPDPYYGFQEFHLGEDGRSGEHWMWIQRNHPEYHLKPDDEIPVELHNSYWTASHTIDFIRDCARQKEPFFAFCSFVDPHNNYNPPPPYRYMYREQDMPRPIRRTGEHVGKPDYVHRMLAGSAQMLERTGYHRAQYYGEVSFIDDSIGRVMDALEQNQVRDDTLIVFISDHGDLLGDHDLFFKGQEHYRGCTNLPFFVNWPGRVKPGQVIDGLVEEIDVFPTIAEFANLPRTPGVQGRSQAPVLRGESGDTGYSSILVEHAINGEPIMNGSVSDTTPDVYTLRTREWRLTYVPSLRTGELYDLADDPDELVNRWTDSKFDDIRSKLKDQLLDRVLSNRDPLPIRENRY